MAKLVEHLSPDGVIVFSMSNVNSLNRVSRPYVIGDPNASRADVEALCARLGLERVLQEGSAAASWVVRTLAASAVMALPAYLSATVVSGWIDGPVGSLVSVLTATAADAVTFVAVQRPWHSPELAFFAGGLRRLRPRGA